MADSTMRMIEVNGEKFVIFGDLAKPTVFCKAPANQDMGVSILGIGTVREATALEVERVLMAWEHQSSPFVSHDTPGLADAALVALVALDSGTPDHPGFLRRKAERMLRQTLGVTETGRELYENFIHRIIPRKVPAMKMNREHLKMLLDKGLIRDDTK